MEVHFVPRSVTGPMAQASLGGTPHQFDLIWIVIIAQPQSALANTEQPLHQDYPNTLAELSTVFDKLPHQDGKKAAPLEPHGTG